MNCLAIMLFTYALGYSQALDATSFYLMRHGVSQWNEDQRVQGHANVDLNANGRASIIRMREALKKINLTKIYTDDLDRTFHTAQIAAEASCIQRVISDRRLRGMKAGFHQGFSGKDCHALFAIAKKDWTFRINPEAETYEEVRNRLLEILGEIQSEVEPHDKVLIVTHGAIIRILRGMSDESMASGWKVPHEQVFHFEIDSDLSSAYQGPIL